MVQIHVYVSLLCGILTGIVATSRSDFLRNGFLGPFPGYPNATAKKLIEELKAQNVIFINDKLFIQEDETDKHEEHVFTRISGGQMPEESDEKSEKLCDSEVQYNSPHVAKSTEDRIRIILNDAEQPVQTFRYEICKSRVCSEKINLLHFYRAECQQIYTHQEMYYIDRDNKISVDYFPIPTCCSCNIVPRHRFRN